MSEPFSSKDDPTIQPSEDETFSKSELDGHKKLSLISKYFFSIEKRLGERLVRLIKFAVVSTAGLGLNLLVVFLCLLALRPFFPNDPIFTFSLFKLTIDIEKIIVAQFIAILVVMVFNYLVNKFWTFKKIEEQAQFNPIIQFIKFAIVGASGTVVNLGLVYLIATILNGNEYLAATVGFVVSVLSNFILNDIWTFNPRFAKKIKNDNIKTTQEN